MQRRHVLSLGAAFAAATALRPAFAAGETLRVGSTPTGVPFTFLDTQSNSIQGIMVDLIQAIGKDAGFAATIEPLQFSALIGALTANRIDLIAAAMFITPQRKEVIEFSDPIYTYGEALFVPKGDAKDYVSIQDMKGMTVGVQVGTAFVEPMRNSGLFAEVKLYDTIPDILRDVNVGRLQAGFADAPIVGYNLQLGRFPEARMVKSYKPTITGSVGIGLRKGDGELLKRVNASLAKLKTDGTVKTVLAKWGQE